MKLVVVTKHESDGMIAAVCPSLPWCVSRARSVEEALEKHQEAVRVHMASLTNFVPGDIEFQVVNA